MAGPVGNEFMDPIFDKVNTLGVTFKQGEISDFQYEAILENLMGIEDESEILGIENKCDLRFIFKVSSSLRYSELRKSFSCRDIKLNNGSIIRVDDISTKGTIVDISRVPFEFTNEMLSKVLSKYGDVIRCENYYRSYGKYSHCTETGDRVAWIILKTHIPCTIFIKQLDNFFNVTYDKQPFTCNKCGKRGHSAKWCKIARNERLNYVDLQPLLADLNNNVTPNNVTINGMLALPSNDPSQQLEMEISETSALDVHIDPSQTTTVFNCTRPHCEYSTNYEHIFKTHLGLHTSEKPYNKSIDSNASDKQHDTGENTLSHADENSKKTHTGENTKKSDLNSENDYNFKCNFCNFSTADALEYLDHISTHDDGISFSCSDCDYQCKNEHVLNTHLSSHNIHICLYCNFKGESAKKVAEHSQMHNLKQYKCTVCNQSYNKYSKLINHMNIHIIENEIAIKHAEVISPTTDKNGNSGKRVLPVTPENDPSKNNRNSLRTKKAKN